MLIETNRCLDIKAILTERFGAGYEKSIYLFLHRCDT